MILPYKERIVNFFSTKINTHSNNDKKVLNVYDIEEEYYNLLSDILLDCNLSVKKRKLYFSMLYKLIFYTRDSVYGLNNTDASYIMIGALIQFGLNNKDFTNEMNLFALNALSSFIQIDGFSTAYGDWNDIKYFCNYLKNVIAFNNNNDVTDYNIFKDIIWLYVDQLIYEERYPDNISSIAPYMPREKSKVFGWLAYYISTTYYQFWLTTATTHDAYNRAARKCLTHYRALIANPNKLPMQSQKHIHKEDNNKIIDNWTKLLLEVSNERYLWADVFSHIILEETLLKQSHNFLAKEIKEQVVEEPVVVEEEPVVVEEEPVVVEEEEPTENETVVVEEAEAEVEVEDENKKSSWFGWLGWN